MAREAEVLQGQGKTIAEVLKQPGVSDRRTRWSWHARPPGATTANRPWRNQ